LAFHQKQPAVSILWLEQIDIVDNDILFRLAVTDGDVVPLRFFYIYLPNVNDDDDDDDDPGTTERNSGSTGNTTPGNHQFRKEIGSMAVGLNCCLMPSFDLTASRHSTNVTQKPTDG
jgi:hypothetical protein